MLLHRYRNQRTTIMSTPFFTSLDEILAEIVHRFSGNDEDVICAFGDIPG